MSGTVEYRRQTTVEKASPYIQQFATVYNAFGTKPSETIAGYMDTMVRSLVTYGYWARMDLLYITANNTASNANINWINPGTFDLTDPASTNPTFIAYEGYQGDATSDYLTTGYIPLNNENHTSLNSATIGVWCLDWRGGGNDEVPFGSAGWGGVLSRTEIQMYSPTYPRAFVNSSGTATIPASGDGDEAGLHIMTRRGATDNEYYVNNVSVATSTAATTASSCPGALILLGKSTPTNIIDNFYGGRVSLAFYMDGISDSEATDLYNIFNTYITAIMA
jgi:hypothetical protein